MKYDVFISYRRDGGSELARLLFEHMKAKGYSVFFDLERLRSGAFDTNLYASIEKSNNVVVVLPAHALDRCGDPSDWLRLEVECALRLGKNIVPVMLHGFEWPGQLPESISMLPKFNGVEMSSVYFAASLERICSLLVGTADTGSEKGMIHPHSIHQRVSNKYFTAEDEAETRRLQTQRALLKEFDRGTYERVRDAVGRPVVLDLGSHDGEMILDRFSNDVQFLLGVECDEETVRRANERHVSDGHVKFVCADLESPDLPSRIQDGMTQLGISEFNVINMSMIVMHLKNPLSVIKTVRRFLAKGGMIVIRDIDDGLNIAYPDEGGDFSRVVDICARNETSGFRHSGRQINAYLRRAGYGDVRLEKMGITTTGMDFEARDALFDTYFSFVRDDLRIMTERHPEDGKIAEDYRWYCENYDALSERFLDESFFFSLGFMLFTARKLR